MRPVDRTVEHLGNVCLDIVRLHLEASEEVVPCISRGLVDAVEVVVRNLGFSVATRLLGRDERDTGASVNSSRLVAIGVEREHSTNLRDEADGVGRSMVWIIDEFCTLRNVQNGAYGGSSGSC